MLASLSKEIAVETNHVYSGKSEWNEDLIVFNTHVPSILEICIHSFGSTVMMRCRGTRGGQDPTARDSGGVVR